MIIKVFKNDRKSVYYHYFVNKKFLVLMGNLSFQLIDTDDLNLEVLNYIFEINNLLYVPIVLGNHFGIVNYKMEPL